jgi:hypothetical protein
VFGDRRIQRSCRHLKCYRDHTYGRINIDGQMPWVKLHIISTQGIQLLNPTRTRSSGQHRRRLPHPRSSQRDQTWSIPGLDAVVRWAVKFWKDVVNEIAGLIGDGVMGRAAESWNTDRPAVLECQAEWVIP